MARQRASLEAETVLRRLHPRLSSSIYLKNHPQVVIEWRDELRKLSRWLDAHPGTVRPLTARERSLEIFDDEKALYRYGRAHRRAGIDLPNLLRRMRITDAILGIDRSREPGGNVAKGGGDTLEYFLSSDLRDRKTLRLVISENLDPWREMKVLLLERGSKSIFGTGVDGAVYGQGTLVTEAGSLARLEKATGFEGMFTYLWWGDIDRAGIWMLGEMQRQSGRVIAPFTAAYEAMLAMSDLGSLPKDRSSQKPSSALIDSFASELSPLGGERFREVLQRGLRLPQEMTRITTSVAAVTASSRIGSRDSWRPTFLDRSQLVDDDWDEQNVFLPYEEDYDLFE